jgi:HD-GYP domain-containing protein (c-di-GMP phosphodiesterase class II)
VAARLAGGTHAILARATSETGVEIINVTGFPGALVGGEIANGQGVVGAAMLSRQPVAIADVADSFDLASPPDLAANGLRGALAVPISHQGTFWGALAVFTPERREWTEEDKRLLGTIGNQVVVALKNAELYDASQKMVWELGTLMSGLTAVTSTISLPQVLQEVMASAAKACGAQITVLALEEHGHLVVKAAVGTDEETAQRLALELGGKIVEAVFNDNQPYNNYVSKPGASAGPLDPRAVLCVPLRLRGEPIGVIFLANYAEGTPFTDDHKRVVTELGAQASVAIDNARLFNDREAVMLESLRAMAQLVDAKDRYTAGHSDRVTEYAMIIAREMQYAPGDSEAWHRFRRGCLLHDLGKINVPDAVLSKPGKLTDEEFAQLRKHPVVGYDVLKNLHMLTDELIVVRSHHERFDGKGYPDAKRGDELPIIAWIAAGADAFDAMTSDRPYRKGMSIELALSEIVKHAGTQFHPAVSQAFIQAFEKGQLKVIPQESLFKDAPVVGVIENPVAAS